MIRALVIVAVAGFLMAVGCISAAVAIGGPEAIARSGWSWTFDDHPRRFGVWRHEVRGPQSEREFPWSGARALRVDVPAEIEYVQAPGPAKLTIRGPAAVLDRVRVEGGRIFLASPGRRWASLHIRLSAPDVSRFELSGANQLDITGYKQDELVLSVSGQGQIEAQGETRSVRLSVSGAGDADLSDLKTQRAEVAISGAGQATVGPTEWARVDISGLGDVELVHRPKQLETNVTGAGHVRQPEAEDTDDDGRGPARPT